MSVEPEILRGEDGEPPTFVSCAVATTPAEAVAYAVANDAAAEDTDPAWVVRVLMRELDPIACRARGYEEGWWIECTARAKTGRSFWRIGG